MTTWVLIWTISTMNMSASVTSGAAYFNTPEACSEAKAALEASGLRVRAECIKDGL